MQEKINSISETINGNTSSSKEYQISGTYYNENALGDEPNYTFLDNNKVTFGSLWTCNGWR